jgi:hypothetical protein
MVFPIVALPDSPGTMICTNLNLHYVRNLSCKYDRFWLSGSRGENLSMPSSNFCIFVIITTLKIGWLFFVQFRIPFT